jgi:shikimate kinase / 3-dehydroquinate synthase
MTTLQRPLLLNGFMASGKSTVGRALASLAKVPFVDLDERVETAAGKSVAEMFAHDGEATFRRWEREQLQLLLDSTPCVVALGGGALLHTETRFRAVDRAVVVTLTANLETLVQRASSDGAQVRPLLRGADLDHVRTLLELRRRSYAEAHAVVSTENRSPSTIAAELLEIWRRNPICVASGEQSYVVDVGADFAPSAVAKDFGREATGTLLVTDHTVNALYGDAYRSALSSHGHKHSTFSMAPGEEHKHVGSLQAIWDHALAQGSDRKLNMIGVGGGVVTDVTGFAAATWMRGVPWVSVPTTLLGMVDASVGGKTAVDLPLAKNCVGAFWQPLRVYCDIAHLQSEPERGFRSGFAEVVKTALLGDAALFELLERHCASHPRSRGAFDSELLTSIVRRCIAVKASIVTHDPRENGIRAALNLGHTVGHAIEAVGGFGHHTHGEAVSLGLVAALRIGSTLGITPPELTRRVTQLLNNLGLPTALGSEPLEQAAGLLGYDKKRGGDEVKFVFCPEPGRVVFERLPIPRLRELTVGAGNWA